MKDSPKTRFAKRPTLFVPLLAGVLVVGLGAVIASRNYEDVQQNFTPESPEAILKHPENTGIAGLQDASFVSSDHTVISAWYAPSHNGAAILLVHGTSADRSSLLVEMKGLAEAGFGVMAFDIPGYGMSGGEIRWGADAIAAVSSAVGWLSARQELKSGRIGALGLSMGGYILTQVAAHDQRVRSLVLEAVPPDIVETTRWQHRKWGFVSEQAALWALHHSPMPWNNAPPKDLIAAFSPRPLLIIGGDQDQTVPVFMTRQLFELAAEPKTLWVVDGAGHGGYWMVAPGEYAQRLASFFRQTLLSDMLPASSAGVHS